MFTAVEAPHEVKIGSNRINQNSLEMIYYDSGDTPKPTTNPEVVRIYGHELWAFTQKAYFAFAAKDIPFQKCSMDMQNKAKWHMD